MKDHDDLMQEPLSPSALLYLGSAVENMGKALSQRSLVYVMSDLSRAQKNINKFVSCTFPLEKISEQESELSSRLHTYLRKYMDGSLSVLLYQSISDEVGSNIWFSFIKEIVKTNGNYAAAIQKIDDDCGTKYKMQSDLFMKCYLELWGKELFTHAYKEVMSWS